MAGERASYYSKEQGLVTTTKEEHFRTEGAFVTGG